MRQPSTKSRTAGESGPMKHGTTIIALVEDPDGYKVKLIQRSEALASLARITPEHQSSKSS
jgi:hypothetical protein